MSLPVSPRAMHCSTQRAQTARTLPRPPRSPATILSVQRSTASRPELTNEKRDLGVLSTMR